MGSSYKYRAITLCVTAWFLAPCASSIETCGRTAIVGHQEVLVDTSSGHKGEGLRFFLEQDEMAKSYLDTYQENNRIRWQNAALGTAGSGLILFGAMSNASSETKMNYYVVGVSMILVNFLVARTLEMANERNLIRAIDEYNQRHLPRIHFGPEFQNFPISSQNSEGSHQQKFMGHKIHISKIWEF